MFLASKILFKPEIRLLLMTEKAAKLMSMCSHLTTFSIVLFVLNISFYVLQKQKETCFTDIGVTEVTFTCVPPKQTEVKLIVLSNSQTHTQNSCMLNYHQYIQYCIRPGSHGWLVNYCLSGRTVFLFMFCTMLSRSLNQSNSDGDYFFFSLLMFQQTFQGRPLQQLHHLFQEGSVMDNGTLFRCSTTTR